MRRNSNHLVSPLQPSLPLSPSLRFLVAFLLWLASAAVFSEAWVPGVVPKDWQEGEDVEVKVGSLLSVSTQTPMNIYDLPVCRPEKLVSDISNLGDMLMGQTLQNTMYKLQFRKNQLCTKLCPKRQFTEEEVNMLKARIDDKYKIHWQVDYMFALMQLNSSNGDKVHDGSSFTFGVPIGTHVEDKYYLHNHVTMTLLYHPRDPRKGRIVGFEVQPYSIHQIEDGDKLHCTAQPQQRNDTSPAGSVEPLPSLELSTSVPAIFSYDVRWQQSDIPWSSRFSIYLRNVNDSRIIHWFAILNSLVIVLLLSAIVAMILLRVLHRDIAKYNEVVMDDDDEAEETGWKLVHGDVFRKPPHSTVLAALTGSGIQIFCMMVITVVCGGFGMFSLSYRGGLLQTMLVLWALLGAVAGYTAARFYKMFKSTNWKMTIIRTALIFPGVLFAVFFVLNLVMKYEGSSATVPFSGLVHLLTLWFLISTPLVFAGAYVGYREDAISVPVRVNKIPRQIPTQPWFMHSSVSCLVGGALPFGAMFTELFFLFSSIWQHRFYYLFGFLFLVLVLLVVTCAEISLTLVYFQLVCEDYNWWWRSFYASAATGLYVILYSVYYYFSKLRITRISGVLLYFGYSFIIAYGFFIFTGSIGFISSFFFLRKIYGSIKVD